MLFFFPGLFPHELKTKMIHETITIDRIKKDSYYDLRALIKLIMNEYIDIDEVRIMTITLIKPIPPDSILFGSLIPINAISIINVNNTAI